ncbi:MAG TPA: hypothetical protein VHZ51_30275 [Ktedonobacteraceae bacterium]|nr:hypothetical protein [Ktedonobacteraceae bacterium]
MDSGPTSRVQRAPKAARQGLGRMGERLATAELVARYYLDLHACSERSWRVNVVAVQMSSSGRLEEIRLYEHAFAEET